MNKRTREVTSILLAVSMIFSYGTKRSSRTTSRTNKNRRSKRRKET